MNRPVNEDIDDVLSRLDELYLLRKTRYVVQQGYHSFKRVEHQSVGISLIPPSSVFLWQEVFKSPNVNQLCTQTLRSSLAH